MYCVAVCCIVWLCAVASSRSSWLDCIVLRGHLTCLPLGSAVDCACSCVEKVFETSIDAAGEVVYNDSFHLEPFDITEELGEVRLQIFKICCFLSERLLFYFCTLYLLWCFPHVRSDAPALPWTAGEGARRRILQLSRAVESRKCFLFRTFLLFMIAGQGVRETCCCC